MNVSTILVSREEAERKLEQYKRIVEKKRVPEDKKLQSLYSAVSKGARVLNLLSAFQQTGLNELRQPRLAIARADWTMVHCLKWSMPGPNYGIRFSDRSDTWRTLARDISLRLDLPHIPPDCRPKFGLNNYHILFEVKTWKSYPVDPFLMRRICGNLYVVEAEWELTELEAGLLSAMATDN